jgi:nucleoside-triphosphatase
MPLKILLTGRPGYGKTTLIRRVVAGLRLPAGGFYTQELRAINRERPGTEVTLANREPLVEIILNHLQEKSDG